MKDFLIIPKDKWTSNEAKVENREPLVKEQGHFEDLWQKLDEVNKALKAKHQEEGTLCPLLSCSDLGWMAAVLTYFKTVLVEFNFLPCLETVANEGEEFDKSFQLLKLFNAVACRQYNSDDPELSLTLELAKAIKTHYASKVQTAYVKLHEETTSGMAIMRYADVLCDGRVLPEGKDIHTIKAIAGSVPISLSDLQDKAQALGLNAVVFTSTILERIEAHY